MTRWSRGLLAFLLIAEALSTAFWIAGIVPKLASHDALVVSVVVLRGLVGALQLGSGAFLLAGRPAATVLAQFALISSAVLNMLEIGFGFAPTSLEPMYRWPIVALYWVYALGWTAALRFRMHDGMHHEDHEGP